VFHAVTTALAAASAVACLCAPMAAANPNDIPVNVDAQCRDQYPGGQTFQDATAYVIAPGDAYSWRCQQSSKLPGGGQVSNLAVDPGAYCTRLHLGAPVINDASSPGGWACRP
jgi:hypothetical protein